MKKMLRVCLCVLMVAATMIFAISVSAATNTSIKPGNVWYDTAGNPIEAHGGGILKVGNTYYWYGEDHSNGWTFQDIACYSSTDLMNWTREQNSLTLQPSGDLGPNRVVERPKVLYNASTGKYVMWMHIDNTNYSEAKVGVATSDTPNGVFTYIGSFNPDGHQSRDMTVFQDGTNAWLVSLGEDSSGNINQNDRIYPLTPDYLGVNPEVYTFVNAGREGLAVMKAGNYYFILSSACNGWNPSQQKYTYSTSMSSGWNTTWTNFGDSTCYQSQTNFALPVTGSGATSYIFMGDRWNSNNLSDSRYIWLPMNISGTSLTMNYYDTWQIDLPTGALTFPTYYKFKNKNSGKMMDDSGASLSPGSNIIQYTDNGGLNQNWRMEAVGSYYKIINRWSGLCLAISGASTADGAQAIQWTDTGGYEQQWMITDMGGGVYKIVNRNSGKTLEVPRKSRTNGTNVDQCTDNGGSNQRWSLIQVN